MQFKLRHITTHNPRILRCERCQGSESRPLIPRNVSESDAGSRPDDFVCVGCSLFYLMIFAISSEVYLLSYMRTVGLYVLERGYARCTYSMKCSSASWTK